MDALADIDAVAAEAGDSQFAIALRRALAEPATVDPQAAVARFDSAW